MKSAESIYPSIEQPLFLFPTKRSKMNGQLKVKIENQNGTIPGYYGHD